MVKRLIQALATLVVACMFACVVGCSGGASLANGTYDIDVETDSNMFHIDSCELTVADGKMTAQIVLPGEGFSRIYFGTAEEAAKASDADIYDYKLNEAKKYTFTLPVSELDKELPVAAWGQRRDRWYDHTIQFVSPTNTTPKQEDSSNDKADTSAPSEGDHTVAVTLEGGSGKASVESPAQLKVEGDKMTATIVWSSSNYDKMVVDGKEYAPVSTSGNSVFEIEIKELGDIEVQAETTAMSEPHMIDYVLHFDAASVK